MYGTYGDFKTVPAVQQVNKDFRWREPPRGSFRCSSVWSVGQPKYLDGRSMSAGLVACQYTSAGPYRSSVTAQRLRIHFDRLSAARGCGFLGHDSVCDRLTARPETVAGESASRARVLAPPAGASRAAARREPGQWLSRRSAGRSARTPSLTANRHRALLQQRLQVPSCAARRGSHERSKYSSPNFSTVYAQAARKSYDPGGSLRFGDPSGANRSTG
jgi:hypothetical protein